jgi:hypothetical protein
MAYYIFLINTMSDSHICAILLELFMKWIDFASPYLKIESQREWQAHFGVSPLSVEKISNICPYLKPKSLLMALNFLSLCYWRCRSSMLGVQTFLDSSCLENLRNPLRESRCFTNLSFVRFLIDAINFIKGHKPHKNDLLYTNSHWKR